MRSFFVSLALGAACLTLGGAMPSQAEAQMRWARQPGWGTYYGNYAPSYQTYYQGFAYPQAYAYPTYYNYYGTYTTPGYFGYGYPSYGGYYQNYTTTYGYPIYSQGYWPYMYQP